MHCTDKYSQHSSIIWPVWLNGWVFVYELSGCGFKSSCSHYRYLLHCCRNKQTPEWTLHSTPWYCNPKRLIHQQLTYNWRELTNVWSRTSQSHKQHMDNVYLKARWICKYIWIYVLPCKNFIRTGIRFYTCRKWIQLLIKKNYIPSMANFLNICNITSHVYHIDIDQQ